MKKFCVFLNGRADILRLYFESEFSFLFILVILYTSITAVEVKFKEALIKLHNDKRPVLTLNNVSYNIFIQFHV